MNQAITTNYASMHRASVITLIVGVIVSLVIHLGVGIGASGYFGQSRSGLLGSAIEIEPDADRTPPPNEELKLGMEDSKHATINWLGVIEDPQLGQAPIAEVEQAEFTPRVGNAPSTSSSEPSPEIIAQEPKTEPVDREPIEEPMTEPVEAPVDAVAQKPDSVPEQVELEPEHVLDETKPQILIEPEPEPEPAPEPEPPSESQAPVGPSLVSVEPTEASEPIDSEPVEEVMPVEAQQPADPSPSPTAQGRIGVLSDRESAATIIKRAKKVDAKQLNKPIVDKGLEITTVEPKFPASVRFTQLPRNPVLMIRFDATGRVSKVYFLRDGKRVFDTGALVVDEPLLNAVYQWRAKGKEIDALEMGNPESFIEISMRIIFHKDKDAGTKDDAGTKKDKDEP